MRRSKRFSEGRFHAGRFSGRVDAAHEGRFTISVSGVTDNTTFGPTAQVGLTLRAVATQFPNGKPDVVNWQWRNAQGDIPGATRPRYRPVAGDDLAEIFPRATPSNDYAAQNGPRYLVRFAPPAATQTLPDVQFSIGSGGQTIDSAVAFTGRQLTYSVTTLVPGITINNTGLLSLSTTVEANGIVSIAASNSGGSEIATFRVQVSD